MSARTRLISAILLATSVLGASAATAAAQEVELTPGGDPLMTTRARVIGVIDAETIRVRRRNGVARKVKLIGVDAPLVRRDGVVECGSLAALDALLRRAFTKSRDTDGDGLRDKAGGRGREVSLTTDPALRSPKGYTLAYVEPVSAGAQFNVVQILNGWGKIDDYGGASLGQGSNLAAAQYVARSNETGVWGGCNGDFHADGSATF